MPLRDTLERAVSKIEKWYEMGTNLRDFGNNNLCDIDLGSVVKGCMNVQ